MLFGVCGGLAKYFGIDSSVMRIIMVLLALAGGVGVLMYFIMVIIVPLEGSTTTAPRDTIVENAEDIRATAENLGKEIRDTFGGKKAESEDTAEMQARRRNWFGVIIIAIGVIILLATFGVFHYWGVLWAVALIVIGAVIILSVTRKK
jgi:phage shock protein PspC (stress-responsive transcriptional regulator)